MRQMKLSVGLAEGARPVVWNFKPRLYLLLLILYFQRYEGESINSLSNPLVTRALEADLTDWVDIPEDWERDVLMDYIRIAVPQSIDERVDFINRGLGFATEVEARSTLIYNGALLSMPRFDAGETVAICIPDFVEEYQWISGYGNFNFQFATVVTFDRADLEVKVICVNRVSGANEIFSIPRFFVYRAAEVETAAMSAVADMATREIGQEEAN